MCSSDLGRGTCLASKRPFRPTSGLSWFSMYFRAAILTLASVYLFAQTCWAQTSVKPSGVPRMPDGKPDLSGIWVGPFVNDMTKSLKNQQGSGPLELTEWGKQKKATQVDVSIQCLPTGYTRSTNAPFPMEIEQRADRVVFQIGRAHV